jgi:Asp/Glu/hydantoin racemase
MTTHRISQLTATQLDAVFHSDRFCLLTDSQLAALHHRSEQLKAHQLAVHRKRRRRRLIVAVVVAGCAALAPFWLQVFTALGLALLLVIWGVIWLAAIMTLWHLLRGLWAAITGKTPAA